MELASALKNPYLSKDKEELFTYKLFYEIKKTGLEHGVDFELLEPVIDKNGYDVLIKHRRFSKPIQLKCAEASTTKSWKINKRFFRPVDLPEADTILSNANAGHVGLGGGVLLIEYSIGPMAALATKYYYFDFVCLSFFQRSIRPWPLEKEYTEFVRNIFDDRKRKFALPKALLFEVTIEQFLNMARILPIQEDLLKKNPNSWYYNYPPLDEVVSNKRPAPESKTINALLSDGSYSQSAIELCPIFESGLNSFQSKKS